MGWDLFVWSDLTLGPLLQGQTKIAKHKSVFYSFIIGPRGLGWESNLWEIIGWEFSGMVKFDLRPFLQGQTRIAKLKSASKIVIPILLIF